MHRASKACHRYSLAYVHTCVEGSPTQTGTGGQSGIRGASKATRSQTQTSGGRTGRVRNRKRLAARFYQLKTGHALTGEYLHQVPKSRPSAQCWWSSQHQADARAPFQKSRHGRIGRRPCGQRHQARQRSVQNLELFADEVYPGSARFPSNNGRGQNGATGRRRG